MAIIGGVESTTIEKWILDAKEYEKPLKSVARELRKQMSAAKDAELVQKALGGTMDSTAASMAKGTLAAGIITGAFNKLKGSIGGLVDIGLTWNDWIGDNSAALDGMQAATAGIIDKMVLVRAKTKLTTGDYQASEAQLQALSKAAVIYARVVKVDLRAAMDALSDAVVTGRASAFKKLGISIDFTGSTAEKSAAALRELESRFGDVTIKAENTNEKISQVKASLSDLTGEVGHAIQASQLFQGALEDIGLAVRSMTGDVKASIEVVRRYAVDILPLMGLGGSDLQRSLIIGANAAQRMQAQTAGYQKDYQTAMAMGPPAPTGGAGPAGKSSGGRGGRRESELDAFRRLTSEGDLPKLGMSDFGIEQDDSAQRTQQMIKAQEELNILRVEEEARTQAATKALQQHNRAVSLGKQEMLTYTQAVSGAAASLASGFVGAVDAAIQSGANLGYAVLEVVKQTSMMLSGQFFSRAAASFAAASVAATNPFTAWEAPILSAQGSAYLGWGALAAAGGLGLSLVGAAAQGKGAFASGGGGSSAPSFASSGGSSGSSYRPQSDRSDRDKDRPFQVVVQIYPDPADPSAMAHWRKKIRAEMGSN